MMNLRYKAEGEHHRHESRQQSHPTWVPLVSFGVRVQGSRERTLV